MGKVSVGLGAVRLLIAGIALNVAAARAAEPSSAAAAPSAASSSPVNSTGVLYFLRGTTLWRQCLPGGRASRLGAWLDPDVSPDGTQVAYTASLPHGGRGIGFGSLTGPAANKRIPVPGTNTYGPRWSPDGLRLLVNHWDEHYNNWRAAVVSPTQGQFAIVSVAPAHSDDTAYNLGWDASSASVWYVADGAAVVRVDLAGHELQRMDYHKVFPEPIRGLSSAETLEFSRSGMYMAVGIEATTAHEHGPLWPSIVVAPLAGGPPALWTAPNLHGWSPRWASDGTLVFVGFADGDVPASVGPEDFPRGKTSAWLTDGSRRAVRLLRNVDTVIGWRPGACGPSGGASAH